ncbi:MAG: hypothetical protein F6K31_39730 [Symploca sp. SIO2G7]|nr:hypothetical protein [Symploca sp. SIO2G7]
MAETKRLQVPALGEWYDDLLTVDAWVNNRTKVVQAQSLLCSKLQERENRMKERIEYLAKKRGISPEDMWIQILSGKAQKMSSDEIEGVIEDNTKEREVSSD